MTDERCIHPIDFTIKWIEQEDKLRPFVHAAVVGFEPPETMGESALNYFLVWDLIFHWSIT
jgi:hypothetical protein